MTDRHEEAVARHYARNGLLDDILQGLEAAGHSTDRIDPVVLAPVDEFHTAGRIMTLKTLEMLPDPPSGRVLDIGCGIGGTSRHLASTYECEVEGLDLTPAYVETAKELTARTGLAEQCHFTEGSALDMPFDPGTFDLAVTFHVAMNIEDRGRFYSEAARVLKPGASLALFDVMKGPGSGMLYPVPWAETEATSFLKTPEEMRQLLDRAGFRLVAEESQKDFALDFFRKIFAAPATGGPPPLGLHLLTGENSPQKFRNYLDALEADQIEPWIMIARKA